MTDRRDFLAAIIDRPDDDLPRLVYADYLEESGDEERAEFIRLQCELAKLPPDDPARIPLAVREKELLKNREAWIVPGMVATRQTFHRGFVESMETTAESLVRFADAIFCSTPLRHLRAANADGPVEDFVRIEGLKYLTFLDVSNCSSPTVNRILENAPLARLERLAARNCRIWPEGVAAMAGSPVVVRLKALDIAGNPITDEGVAIIASVPSFAALNHLMLRSNEQSEERCIHLMGARAIADSQTLNVLVTLDLAGHYIGDAGLFELGGSRNFGTLRELDLSYNEIGASGIESYRSFVNSPLASRLRYLNLSGNRIDPEREAVLREWQSRRADRKLEMGEPEGDILE